MKRYLICCMGLAGCMSAHEATALDDPNLPIIRDYREAGDPCKFVGESAVTVDFLDDAADMVACPTEYDGLAAFVSETGAREVGTYKDWTLFSVPYR